MSRETKRSTFEMVINKTVYVFFSYAFDYSVITYAFGK